MRHLLTDWSLKWQIPHAAMQDLYASLLRETMPVAAPAATHSEARVQQEVRFAAPGRGQVLWRNNVGAMTDPEGRTIRYGICNDSKKLNERYKSADLIGITRVEVTPEMAGQVVGVFTARECKPSNWRFTGTDREVAQQAWMDLVNSFGGDARFTTGD